MNHYGVLAQRHWRRHKPAALATLADPAAHFEALGIQIETEVTSLRDQLLGRRRRGEDLESFRLRAYQARRQAAEVVLAELVWASPASEGTGTETAGPGPEHEEDPALAAHDRRLGLVSASMAALPGTWTEEPASPPPP